MIINIFFRLYDINNDIKLDGLEIMVVFNYMG